MAGIEIANIIKKYAKIMVGSQEVELGTGWHYQRALSIFQQKSPDAIDLAQHIVKMFGVTYSSITDDYTQSAFDLSAIDDLEKNIDTVALKFLDALKKQKNNSVKDVLRVSGNKDFCTHFDEPSYLDIHHLYSNLLANLHHMHLVNSQEEIALKKELAASLEEGRDLIKKVVIANCTGKNLRLAQGISIYFPDRKIHTSYRETNFAQTNKWSTLLNSYLS